MCPERSWKRSDDCLRSSPEIRQRYFLEGAVLSMSLSTSSLREDFHLHSHLFLILLILLCCSAETLRGSGLCRNFGRYLASLELPCAAFFASLSAFSLGVKSMCPGTQWICKSMTPFGQPTHSSPSAIADSLSARLIILSCFLWRLSANWWILSMMYWLGCVRWLSSALITAWLSDPRIFGWVNLKFRLLRRWCCEYTNIFPFFSLLSIVSITFLIYFRSIYLKHTS